MELFTVETAEGRTVAIARESIIASRYITNDRDIMHIIYVNDDLIWIGEPYARETFFWSMIEVIVVRPKKIIVQLTSGSIKTRIYEYENDSLIDKDIEEILK